MRRIHCRSHCRRVGRDRLQRKSPHRRPAPVPPKVGVVSVAPERIELTGEWIATLDGNVNAQIRPQVSGYLIKRNYHEGAFVRKGEVLFEIDRRPFENALSQAQAHLAESRAQLAKAERDLARDRPLAEQRAIAQSQLDNDISAHDAAQAAVESAKAAVETAQLNVGFTRVTSLIDGVAAIATAQIGDLVGPQTLLTTVSQLDPIKAYFPLSEQEYLGIAEQLSAPGGPSKLWQAQGGLSLVLADGTTYPQRGTVLAVDREVDPKMGTIRMSALFPESRQRAASGPGRPHQGADVGPDRRAARAAARGFRTPERLSAAGHAQGQPGGDAKRHARRARRQPLGGRVGLKAGEQVVVDGPAVKDGTVVAPHPYAPPAEGAQ